MTTQWNHKIASASSQNFEALALEAFRYQYEKVLVYKSYVDALGVNPENVKSVSQIPFLPIQFFKSAKVVDGNFEPAQVFESSATTGMTVSKHLVKDLSLYEESFFRSFEFVFGAPSKYCIIGLLPSYLERKTSSLVYMVDKLIQKSGQAESGFYLNDWEKLTGTLERLEKKEQPTILIGVTFALLELAERFPTPLHRTIIVETGGMKGRGREMVKQELHDLLKQAFSIESIWAEYGMTELLSQAWSKGNGLYTCPPWMKAVLREEEDPLTIKENGVGALNIIDLANIHSCCFIATEDAGRIHLDGQFEILGRMDGSDLRGCSLLVV